MQIENEWHWLERTVKSYSSLVKLASFQILAEKLKDKAKWPNDGKKYFISKVNL